MARPSSALEPSDPPAGTVATFVGSFVCDPGTGPVDAWTTRTHGLIYSAGDCQRVSTLPTHVCTGWCIGSFGLSRSAVSHLRGAIRPDSPRQMDPLGFEPRASSLQRRHSPTELWALPSRRTALTRIDDGSRRRRRREGFGSLDSSKVLDRPTRRPRERRTATALSRGVAPVSGCGGDPAADSPTATLLRLNPPCEAQIRPPLRRPHPDLTRVI